MKPFGKMLEEKRRKARGETCKEKEGRVGKKEGWKEGKKEGKKQGKKEGDIHVPPINCQSHSTPYQVHSAVLNENKCIYWILPV